MGQIQIHAVENTPYKAQLERLGFRWCRKDGRWEKNSRKAKEKYEDIQEQIPKELPVFIKE